MSLLHSAPRERARIFPRQCVARGDGARVHVYSSAYLMSSNGYFVFEYLSVHAALVAVHGGSHSGVADHFRLWYLGYKL